MLRERGGDGPVGLFTVELAVKAEEDAVCGIDKGIAEIFGHQPRREVFAAGDQLVDAHAAVEPRAQRLHLALDVIAEPQLAADPGKALLDGLQDLVAGHAVGQMRVAEI